MKSLVIKRNEASFFNSADVDGITNAIDKKMLDGCIMKILDSVYVESQVLADITGQHILRGFFGT